MNHQATNAHITPEDLAAYCTEELSEERENTIEAHFAICDNCFAKAKRFLSSSESWTTWTAQAHGEASRSALLIEALQETARQHPRWQERLQQWRERWDGKAEAAVRVILATQEKASTIVTEGLEALMRPGGRWRFVLQPAPRPVLGTVRTRGRARPAPPVVAFAPGTTQARVEFSGAEEVLVCVDDWPPEQTAPLVLLIPTTAGGEPRMEELQRSQEVSYLIAFFKQVAPGEYLIALEPVEPEDGRVQ